MIRLPICNLYCEKEIFKGKMYQSIKYGVHWLDMNLG
jgi:hypothetical protein